MDKAVDGDAVYIRSGTYKPFTIVAKTLTVTGEGRSKVTLTGGLKGIVVNELNPWQLVTIRGMQYVANWDQKPLEMRDNIGSVMIEDCLFQATTSCTTERYGGLILNCAAVTITRCSFVSTKTGVGFTSGHGLRMRNSLVYAFDSAFRGGDCCEQSGRGGDGVWLEGGLFFASKCEFKGGTGTAAQSVPPFNCNPAGAGGSGIGLAAGTSGPVAYTLQCTFKPVPVAPSPSPALAAAPARRSGSMRAAPSP